MNQRLLGSCYEDLAAAYLEQQGLCILKRNYRCRIGEIDLIARDGRYLVFVEVKYRRNQGQGGPLAAVTGKKQGRIGRTAAYYLLTEVGSEEIPCRFDVVAVDGQKLHWIRNAFELSGI